MVVRLVRLQPGARCAGHGRAGPERDRLGAASRGKDGQGKGGGWLAGIGVRALDTHESQLGVARLGKDFHKTDISPTT